MAENYECIDDPNSGLPPPPPPPPSPGPALVIEPPAPQGTDMKIPPPRLNEKAAQGKSSEVIPPAPRLVGNPLSDSEQLKKKANKGCCTIS
uniref:Uncharacterized protein n=1 Tax=Strongyloides stercoralis TaxID=6248 RepID=A0A0K0DT42_STRER